jgi:hypothetical protein
MGEGSYSSSRRPKMEGGLWCQHGMQKRGRCGWRARAAAEAGLAAATAAAA